MSNDEVIMEAPHADPNDDIVKYAPRTITDVDAIPYPKRKQPEPSVDTRDPESPPSIPTTGPPIEPRRSTRNKIFPKFFSFTSDSYKIEKKILN